MSIPVQIRKKRFDVWASILPGTANLGFKSLACGWGIRFDVDVLNTTGIFELMIRAFPKTI